MGRAASDKRSRLVTAAIEQFHRFGVPATSLGDVASAAGIAPGNVYYYFRSKDDLTRAVLDEWCAWLDNDLANLEPDADPWRRLHAFLDRAVARRAGYTTSGCPLAGLSRDLRQGSGLGADAPRAHALQLAWLERQFILGGLVPTEAAGHARFLLAGLQGSFLLAHSADDAAIISDVVARLSKWLNETSQRLAY